MLFLTWWKNYSDLLADSKYTRNGLQTFRNLDTIPPTREGQTRQQDIRLLRGMKCFSCFCAIIKLLLTTLPLS